MKNRAFFCTVTKQLVCVSLKKKKSIWTSFCSLFLNCWTSSQENPCKQPALLEIAGFQNPTGWSGTGIPEYIGIQNPRVLYLYWFGCAYFFGFWIPTGSDLNPTKHYQYMDAGPARTGSTSLLEWFFILSGLDNPSPMAHVSLRLITSWTMQLCIVGMRKTGNLFFLDQKWFLGVLQKGSTLKIVEFQSYRNTMLGVL